MNKNEGSLSNLSTIVMTTAGSLEKANKDTVLEPIITTSRKSGLGDAQNSPVRETGFDIVTASEIMAILSLSLDLNDLRDRLGRIIVGFTRDGVPVTAKDVNAVGS